MSNKKIVLGIVSFTLVILLILILLNKKAKESKNEIKNNYNVTVGYFLSYYELADSGTPIVEYYYFVNNKKYKGSVYTTTKYKDCKNSIRCEGKRFWVIYSPENPKKSLVDLSQEIQGMKDPPFPKTLDSFE